MKIASYEYNGKLSFGLVYNGKIIDKSDLFLNEPDDIVDYIENLNEYTINNKNIETKSGLDLDKITLKAPVLMPKRHVFCVGKNYKDHIDELKNSNISDETYDYPVFFTKSQNTINDPYGTVPLHEGVTDFVDYEGELAIVIGKKGINITEEKAMDYVFGYTIINDVTARDLQKRHKQWFKGKSLDGFCPIGPWIVTKDEIDNPQNLNISTRVNGIIRQESNTEKMIFSIEDLICSISQGFTLYPGDIIATGTPKGVGMGMNPPNSLKKDDKVRITIEKIGYIENIFK